MFQTPTTTSSKVIALLSAQTQWPLAFVPAATGIARTPLGSIFFSLVHIQKHNSGFGPMQKTKVNLENHPPPTEHFLGDSREDRSLKDLSSVLTLPYTGLLEL